MMSAVLVFITCLLVPKLSLSANVKYNKNWMCLHTPLNVLSDKGVAIERYPTSLVELPFSKSHWGNFNDTFSIKFSFKTNSSDGVLFYAISQENYGSLVAVYLEDGKVRYYVRCPTMEALDFLLLSDDRSLTDNNWHNIAFEIPHYNRLKDFLPANITIDGEVPFVRRYPVSCRNISSVILGGVREQDHFYMNGFKALKGHFKGCIKKISASIPTVTPPIYRTVSTCIR